MPAGTQSPDKMILDQAAWSFRRSPDALKALHWLKDSPQEFEKITKEFDEIIKNMNFIIKGNEPINENSFGAVARLKEKRPEPLPSLEELTLSKGGEKSDVLKEIMETFTEVGEGLGENGKWNWATKELLRVMASGLLIEGYARLLSRAKSDELKREIVLGFEETGWFFARESNIMQDVIPWMKEESGDFSPNVRQELQPRTKF